MSGAGVDPFADPELIDERPDERLDLSRLEPWLRARLPRAEGPLLVRQFGGGHANLTYLLRFGDDEYVLRRPPLGPVAPGAHDMGREHRVLSRLCHAFALAPESYLYCDDPSLIGVPFQVMERRAGIVIRRAGIPRLRAEPDLARRVGEMLVDVLADLHGVDRVAAGLGDLGRPEGYVERQVEGWAKRWEAAAHADNPAMTALVAWLRARMPREGGAALVHNDYKLDNVLVAADDPARAVAVLDWDMCTSGDPLMDLGYLLNQWSEPEDPPGWIEEGTIPSTIPGFARRAEVAERYARRSRRDVDDVTWYHAFAAMKFAVIVEQIYIRFVRGQTQDRRFERYGARAALYVAKGCAVAGIDGA